MKTKEQLDIALKALVSINTLEKHNRVNSENPSNKSISEIISEEAMLQVRELNTSTETETYEVEFNED